MKAKRAKGSLRSEWRRAQERRATPRQHRDFFKLTAIYTLGVIVTFLACWEILLLCMPDTSRLDLLQTLTTAFGVTLPDNMPVTLGTLFRKSAVVFIILFLSLALAVLNVFFGAIITVRFIRPRVRLLTSDRGVLNATWNPELPYILLRMCNFHAADLADVQTNVVLMVEETRLENGQEEEVRSYLPVNDFTPQSITLMERRMPWSLAVPADSRLGNSMTKDYYFAPGKPITHFLSKGKTVVSTRRFLEVLVQGTDLRSYSSFVLHRKIPVDEQKGDTYILRLHKGAFKSLPLTIQDPAELEQYV
jgi:hypothetical protein